MLEFLRKEVTEYEVWRKLSYVQPTDKLRDGQTGLTIVGH
jgi:hypothetical protein